MTGRLRRHAAGLVDSGVSVSWVCRRLGLGWPVVHGAYVDLVDPVVAPTVGAGVSEGGAAVGQLLVVLPPVTVLGLDETRRGKVRSQWDPRAVKSAGGLGRSMRGELFAGVPGVPGIGPRQRAARAARRTPL